MYYFEVEYRDEIDNKISICKGLVKGVSFTDAFERLLNFFGIKDEEKDYFNLKAFYICEDVLTVEELREF